MPAYDIHLFSSVLPTVPPINATSDPNATRPDITDISPDITPCENPYTYKIYKSAQNDCIAMENTETTTVEIYKWVHTAEGEISREYREIEVVDFHESEEYDDFYFVGYTIPSKLMQYSLKAPTVAWLKSKSLIPENLLHMTTPKIHACYTSTYIITSVNRTQSCWEATHREVLSQKATKSHEQA